MTSKQSWYFVVSRLCACWVFFVSNYSQNVPETTEIWPKDTIKYIKKGHRLEMSINHNFYLQVLGKFDQR